MTSCTRSEFGPGMMCGALALAVAGAGSIFGPTELATLYGSYQKLGQAKNIDAVCCMNMSEQPTDACQAIFPTSVKLNETFMRSICQHTNASIEDMPKNIEYHTPLGIFTGGIAALGILVLAGYGAYFAYNHFKRGEYTAL